MQICIDNTDIVLVFLKQKLFLSHTVALLIYKSMIQFVQEVYRMVLLMQGSLNLKKKNYFVAEIFTKS